MATTAVVRASLFAVNVNFTVVMVNVQIRAITMVADGGKARLSKG